GLCWRSVNFVSKYDVGKQWPGTKAKVGHLRIEHVDTGNVSRHEIRRELDPGERGRDRGSKAASKKRFGHAGNTFDQRVSTCNETNDQIVDDHILTLDDLDQGLSEVSQLKLNVRFGSFHV